MNFVQEQLNVESQKKYIFSSSNLSCSKYPIKIRFSNSSEKSANNLEVTITNLVWVASRT